METPLEAVECGRITVDYARNAAILQSPGPLSSGLRLQSKSSSQWNGYDIQWRIQTIRKFLMTPVCPRRGNGAFYA